MNTVSQQALVKDPNLRAKWADKLVYIYSGIKQAYWRPGSHGYTDRVGEVGVYDFATAWRETGDAREEDYIEYEEVGR